MNKPPLDAAGVPKAEPTILERLAVEALNEVKAWRDSDGNEGFPHTTREKVEAALMLYEARRIQRQAALDFRVATLAQPSCQHERNPNNWGLCRHCGDALPSDFTSARSTVAATSWSKVKFKGVLKFDDGERVIEGEFDAQEMLKELGIAPLSASAISSRVGTAAAKVLRTYIWKVNNPAASIAGHASFEGALAEMRQALFDAGVCDLDGNERPVSDRTARDK